MRIVQTILKAIHDRTNRIFPLIGMTGMINNSVMNRIAVFSTNCAEIPQGPLFSSSDGGNHWTLLTNTPEMKPRP